MIIPDVNLLLYAELSDFPEHAAARRWWEQALSGSTTVGLCPPSVMGFLRLATSRRIFATPLGLDEAAARIEGWLARPVVQALVPGPDHLRRVIGLLMSTGTGGGLCTDAEIAAYAQAAGGVVHTNDTDFARFPGVKAEYPLAQG